MISCLLCKVEWAKVSHWYLNRDLPLSISPLALARAYLKDSRIDQEPVATLADNEGYYSRCRITAVPINILQVKCDEVYPQCAVGPRSLTQDLIINQGSALRKGKSRM